MRALTAIPGQGGSGQIAELDEPPVEDGGLLVETLAIGVCGTDREILRGEYGSPPAGSDRLVLGHESLGRVLDAPSGSGFAPGDHVVGIVRRPDPVPCPNCAVGEWDMCQNGQYTERGIKEHHGYCSERFRIEPEFAVKVDPALGIAGVLVEPASVVAKAWEHVERIGKRARWTPRRALITGAGPVGLLAALMAQQRGLELHVLDRVTEGPKPELVRSLGGTYQADVPIDEFPAPDVVIECTGVPSLIFDAMRHTASNGIVCLTGLSSGGTKLQVDASALSRSLVMENDVVFGSVNANRRHYEAAAKSLAEADREWLRALLTERTPLDGWQEAFDIAATGIKAVIEPNA